ncbi:MAG: hypothetical protein U0703_26095 [Anaerolineae bacterium]
MARWTLQRMYARREAALGRQALLTALRLYPAYGRWPAAHAVAAPTSFCADELLVIHNLALGAAVAIAGLDVSGLQRTGHRSAA